MSELCTCSIESGIATITMTSGKVNAFDHELINQLSDAFTEVEKNPEVKAVVLAGQAGIFSAGFDLNIMKSSQEQAEALVARGLELLRQLYLFPKPLVMASTGHAIALGAVILLAGDYRVGTTGEFKVGLNESHIGMPLPQLFVELARDRIPLPWQTQAVVLGLLFEPYDAKDVGYYDNLSTPEQIGFQARDKAEEFGNYVELEAFAENKRRLRGALLARFHENSV